MKNDDIADTRVVQSRGALCLRSEPFAVQCPSFCFALRRPSPLVTSARHEQCAVEAAQASEAEVAERRAQRTTTTRSRLLSNYARPHSPPR